VARLAGTVTREPFVAAVVVTYRRPRSLVRTIDAIERQTVRPDVTIVVDNGGDATSTLAGRDGLTVVATGSNIGPAGGYDRGMRIAIERGADRVWTVDDDVEPEAECLARLLSASAALALPTQVRAGGAETSPPAWTGTLIDAEVIRSIGYPRTELFFWAEDTEYFYRAQLAGFRRVRVPDARVRHHTKTRSRRSERTWRLYYEVRNTVHVRLGYRGPLWRRTWKLLPVVVGKPFAILAFEPGKRRALGLWWRGLRDGLSGRLGRVIEPEATSATRS
jgi:rhamnopyranosyl-N-acetylglucosaminyl-diphospho-decaprenol beta-1,3/1,4-galactofuranosyltransferase